ncbi:hypothetical protein KM043_010912 [Ampulex compressa]|nr:hypothetical protein KM043_010912 [Ampulex compressa]
MASPELSRFIMEAHGLIEWESQDEDYVTLRMESVMNAEVCRGTSTEWAIMMQRENQSGDGGEDGWLKAQDDGAPLFLLGNNFHRSPRDKKPGRNRFVAQ